ncbi:MAG: flagellar biosynthesis protein FlhF [Clostridia bacterium]|nr:flagellar biosynthesis protein FlhF [Clostridia bacterium]
MYEAMVLIKQELGNDAVIVSKREIRQKGPLGFFKKKMLEVTAATDVVARPVNGITKKTDTQVQEKRPFVTTAPPEPTPPPVQSPAPAPVQPSNPAPAHTVAATSMQAAGHNVIEKQADSELKEEVQQIKGIVEKLIQQNDAAPMQKESLDLVKELMLEMDLHSVVIKDFENYCKDKSVSLEDIHKDLLNQFLQERFNQKVNVLDVGGRIRTFIGPTGVGKTTTIAKLASNEALVNQKNIGLITIDTYRIGAVEQLKIYANILGIPVKVVFSPEDLPEAIEYFSDKDLIYIDSTGRSHKNIHQLNELKSYLEQCDSIKTYLVLSMVTKNIDFIKTIQNYKKIGFDSLVLTKFDETYSTGNILNAGYFTEKPISYICKGQVVPDDIENASKDTLLNYLWGESK